jgi:hypothetical protein
MKILTKADGSPREFAARAVQPDDQWQDALTKLFPTEVFTAYLAAVAILSGVESDVKGIVSWVVFGAGALATLLYMMATWDPDPQIRREELRFAWPQLVLAVFAFTAWAFSLGGAFQTFPWYEQWIGGVVLVIGALLLTGLNKLIGTFAG